MFFPNISCDKYFNSKRWVENASYIHGSIRERWTKEESRVFLVVYCWSVKAYPRATPGSQGVMKKLWHVLRVCMHLFSPTKLYLSQTLWIISMKNGSHWVVGGKAHLREGDLVHMQIGVTLFICWELRWAIVMQCLELLCQVYVFLKIIDA